MAIDGGNGAEPPGDWVTKLARNVTLLWAAFRAPLCWTLAAGLMINAVVQNQYGHHIDPDLIVIIGALFGYPFFFKEGGK